MSIILIKGISAAAGASTVCANLCASLQQSGRSAIALDLDAKNLLGLWFSHSDDVKQGWAKLFSAENDWHNSHFISPHGTPFVPFGESMIPQVSLQQASAYLANMIKELKEKYQYIILNSPFSSSHDLLESVTPDLILHIVSCEPNSYIQLHRLIKQNPAMQNVLYLANRHSLQYSIYQDTLLQLRHLLGVSLISTQIHFDIAIPEAFANMEPVIYSAPNSQSAKDFQTLATWVLANTSAQQA